MRLISKLLCSSVLVCSSLAASASPYSSLVIFGDSLSDSGNNSLLGLNDPLQKITDNRYIPSSTYGFGTYSNGPVWATQFADMLGLTGLAPALLGGTNFAFGGATTSVLNFPDNAPRTPTLIEQMGAYYFGSPQLGIKGTGGVADSEALYVVAGGGNNVREALSDIGADPGSFASIVGNAASQYASDIGFIVDSLQAGGAKNIIVWNAPNVGAAPAVTSVGAGQTGSYVADSFNGALAKRLTGEIGVVTFDLFGLISTTKGFSNTIDACGVTSSKINCDTALFWDGIHPTTAAHTLIAERMLVTAVPEPETWALMLMGLGFIAYRTRRRTATPVLATA